MNPTPDVPTSADLGGCGNADPDLRPRISSTSDTNGSRSKAAAFTNGSLGPCTLVPINISVKVMGWELDFKDPIYKIIVSHAGQSWTQLRKYTEFQKLYEKLNDTHPECQLKMPGFKKLILCHLTSDFIGIQRCCFSEFVNKLIVIEALKRRTEVQHFLGLSTHTFSPNSASSDSDKSSSSTSSSGNGSNASIPKNCCTKKHPDERYIYLGESERLQTKPSDFEFLKVIGKGSFGKVLLALHKTEQKMYAVKVLHKKTIMRRNEVQHIMAERNVLLKTVHHPFLVSLHFSFQTSEKLFFVLDYVNGGELFLHLQREKKFTEARVKFYGAEMASALGYLHSLNIIYRDLKPENILLDTQGHVRLTDFGLCKECLEPSGTTTTFCGTPEYLAPEVLRKEPYSQSVDWWCLGAVMYEMACGLPPFYSRDTSKMYDAILNHPLVFPSPTSRCAPAAVANHVMGGSDDESEADKKISKAAEYKRRHSSTPGTSGLFQLSPPARHLLKLLLQKDKLLRLGSRRDVAEIREHSFFSDLDWAKLERREIEPPYDPGLDGTMDFRHIDPEFIMEPIPASYGRALASRCLPISHYNGRPSQQKHCPCASSQQQSQPTVANKDSGCGGYALLQAPDKRDRLAHHDDECQSSVASYCSDSCCHCPATNSEHSQASSWSSSHDTFKGFSYVRPTPLQMIDVNRGID